MVRNGENYGDKMEKNVVKQERHLGVRRADGEELRKGLGRLGRSVGTISWRDDREEAPDRHRTGSSDMCTLNSNFLHFMNLRRGRGFLARKLSLLLGLTINALLLRNSVLRRVRGPLSKTSVSGENKNGAKLVTCLADARS